MENEQPLSTSSTSIQQRLKQHGPPPPPLPPLTPTDEAPNSPELVVSNNLGLVDNNVQIHHPASSRSLLRQTFTENLYNNVPAAVSSTSTSSNSRIQPMPGPLKPQMMALELIKNDPTLHVYSNIEEKMHESIDIFLKSGPNSRYGRDTNDAVEMDDELDGHEDVEREDDVMTVSDHEDHESSFIQTRPSTSPEFISLHPITSNILSSSSSNNNNNTSTSSSSVTTQIDAHHLSGFKPVAGGVTKFQPSTMALQSPSNLGCSNNNSISTSSSVGNASDLDGASSIGNNSQSCLVKPAAIV